VPNQEMSFEAGGRSYTLRFTQNALYRLEKALGRQLGEALASLSFVELQAMMWAGLEGARLKRGDPNPYSCDDAGDIIDQLGGIAAAIPIVMEAWRAAMPTPFAGTQPSGAGRRRPLPDPGEVPVQVPVEVSGATDHEGRNLRDSFAARDRGDADPS
jgi:hypothetical protein